jgi:hypothetical protein
VRLEIRHHTGDEWRLPLPSLAPLLGGARGGFY